MSYFDYIRSRKLAEYHLEGRSPYPRHIQETFARTLTSKYIKLEEEHPEYIEMYKNIKE
jgi:hypothetical protein